MQKKLLVIVTIFLFIPLYVSLCLAEDTLNLSIRDADIRDVLQGIAIQNGINIVPDSSVTGNVTINLQNVPFEEGLKILLNTNGLEYEKQGGLYLVKKKSDAASFSVTYQNNKLTVSADNADIRQLLREISKKTGLNIVTETGLTGNVTADVSDVPVDEAIYSILEPLGFEVEENNGIYAIKGGRLQQPQRGQGSFSISYRKDKLFIDVKNAPAVDVLTEIASKCKINLAVVGDVKGNITMRLDDVTLDKTLGILTDASGNAYTIVDDTYMIGDPTVRPGQTNPILESKVIWLKHIQAQDLINSLPTDIPRTNVTISLDRNALIVLGPKKTIERLEGLLSELDIDNPDIRSRQQVAVSVEVDDSGLITVDAKGAPIEEIMREISIRKGIDITLLAAGGVTSVGSRTRARRTANVQEQGQQTQPVQAAPLQTTQRVSASGTGMSDGYVNIRITKATLEETFDSLFKGTGYAYKKETIGSKEIYIIGTGDLMPGGGNPLVASKKIELHYLKAEDVMAILPLTVPDSNVITIEDQNAIMIMGTQGMIDEVESYIAQVDMPAPQIMIEALLIELVRGDSKTLGVNWSWSKDKGKVDISPGLSASFDSLANVPEKFIASLNAMISENKARILSAPRIATTSGMKASIKVGWTDYFETTTEIYNTGGSTTEPTSSTYNPYGGYTRSGFNTLESGITLDITPWVGASGDITVMIRPDIRDAKQISKEHSTIANRTMDTNVRVRDGENIVIGGLIQKNESATESRLPLLGRIPILGHLFKKNDSMNNDTELIIIVRPKIIGSDMKGIEGE
jgi:type II secretory pathway component GspD/PulD (secretin)